MTKKAAARLVRVLKPGDDLQSAIHPIPESGVESDRAIADPVATKEGLVRVVDETGEDYLFPQRLFVEIDLPKEAGRAFRAAS